MEPTSYDLALEAICIKGKEIYGPGYKITSETEPVILKLLTWFLLDEARAAKEGISLNKGILLAGPIGCGKSALMRIFRSLASEVLPFAMISCDQVSLDFAKHGAVAIEQLTTRSFSVNDRPLARCFENLGHEGNLSHYGDKTDLMRMILSVRYDLFIKYGMLTHITTNLDPAEIEERYGYRIRSCMREMFNIIAFPASSPDLRK
ncbi:ATPase [Chitinophaga agrisoli]|nr:ATPase [Chitinophaga agrisoli]